jgi:hypothetical protein
MRTQPNMDRARPAVSGRARLHDTPTGTQINLTARSPTYFVNPLNIHDLFTSLMNSLPLSFFPAERNSEMLFIERGNGAGMVLPTKG